MAGLKSLVSLSLAGSIALTLMILACTLHNNWWPTICLVFYVIVPFPILISRRASEESGFTSSSCPPREWAYFITSGIVISTFALPIILTHVATIQGSACILSLISSAFFFSTILAFALVFKSDDDYSMY